MRTSLLSLLAFLVSGFCFQATAQVTAVMQAKVQIVSGASLTFMKDSFIDLNSKNLTEEINAVSFSLVSAPGTDISVHVQHESPFKNEFGEALQFESLDLDRQSNESGQYKISVNAKVKSDQLLKGHYEGSITAVVEYL